MEGAVRTIVKWVGQDPELDGLRNGSTLDTSPRRRRCSSLHVESIAKRNHPVRKIAADDERVVLRSLRFVFPCRHDLAPVICVSDIGCIPDKRMPGLFPRALRTREVILRFSQPLS